jgi:hypothetical protein
MEEVTKKNINSMNDMSAVDVVFSMGTLLFGRSNIAFLFYLRLPGAAIHIMTHAAAMNIIIRELLMSISLMSSIVVSVNVLPLIDIGVLSAKSQVRQSVATSSVSTLAEM